MKFGLSLSVITAAGISKRPLVEQFEDEIQLTRAARDLRFDSVWRGQHYFTKAPPNWEVIPTLARLIPEAGEMTIGPAVLLLPLHNPVLMAEQLATLDVISKGRLVFGVGLGYRESEFEAFGINRKERVGRLEEGIALIRRLWTQDRITFEGKYFRVKDLPAGTRPVQKPAPPIWFGAHADRAMQRAARLGDGLILNPHASLTTLRRQLDIYGEALVQCGKSFPQELAIRRSLFVASRSEVAWKEAEEIGGRDLRHLAVSGQLGELPDSDRFDIKSSFRELARERFLIGTPEECRQQIEACREKLGTNHFLFRIGTRSRDLEEKIDKLGLIGEGIVQPYLREQSEKPEGRP